MRLRPVTSRGEVFVLPDGAVTLLPFEVLPWTNQPGGVIIRIGETTYWFDPDGRYDGPEMRLPPGSRNEHAEAKVNALLTEGRKNRGKPPERSYFDLERGDDITMERYDDEGIPRKVPLEAEGDGMALAVPEGFEALDDFSRGFRSPKDLGAFIYNVFNELRVSDVIVAGIRRKDRKVDAVRLRKGEVSVDDAAYVQILAALHDGVMSFAELGRPPAETAKCCAGEKHGRWNHPRRTPEKKGRRKS